MKGPNIEDIESSLATVDSLHAPDTECDVFSLEKFALNGQSTEMESKMLDDKFVLGRLAILGQSTVFYAKPNAGKTLMTIWLLIEQIKTGDISGPDVYYINADDNHKGITFKLKLAERHGFNMLALGYNGFNAAIWLSTWRRLLELIRHTVKCSFWIRLKSSLTSWISADQANSAKQCGNLSPMAAL